MSSEILSHYDPLKETRIETDASSYGLGGVIFQKNDEIWKPVAYASRSLTDTESRWAIIEKEMLAITFACSRFRDFIVGLPEFEILTDHNPLVSLLNVKKIDELPIRLQRLRLRIAGLPYHVVYVKGKFHHSADCLSRTPMPVNYSRDVELTEAVNDFTIGFINSHQISDKKLSLLASEQRKDKILSKVIEYCENGWPSKVPIALKQYHSVESELCIVENLLCKANRIVIADSLIKDTLQRIHEGHQGVIKCLERARTTVWWPGMTKHIKDLIASCNVCCRMIVNRAEPLMNSEMPGRPWQRIALDLFHFQNKDYLVVVDFYSRWIEIPLMHSTTASTIINHLKSLFSRFGFIEEAYTDNGPQFSSLEFEQFAREFNFKHVTSSPYFPSSNGMAERAVQTAKTILKKCLLSGDDPYVSLLNYRATPLKSGYSPAELMMGRKLKTNIPTLGKNLQPVKVNMEELHRSESNYRQKYKQYADKKSGAREAKPIVPTDRVLVKGEGDGTVLAPHSAPRSHIIQKDDGAIVRRNRRQFVKIFDASVAAQEPTPEPVEERPTPPLSPPPSQPRQRPRRDNQGKLPVRFEDYEM